MEALASCPARYHAWRRIRSSDGARRQWCDSCDRPTTVCVCASLPSEPLRPTTPMIVLQHRREAKRALNSGSLLSVCVDSERLTTVVARSLAPLWHNERIAAALRRQQHEHLSLLVLFLAPGAISLQAAQRRVEHGERFALVVIDGTWQEARECSLRSTKAAGSGHGFRVPRVGARGLGVPTAGRSQLCRLP